MNAISLLCITACLALLAGAQVRANVPEGKDLEQAVASVKRPFVLINEQELIALRQAVKPNGPKRQAYLEPMGEGESEYAGAGVLAIANRWVNADIRVPEHGGHAHYFYCDCGNMLTLPPDLEPRPSYTCPACGKVFSGEHYDAAVRCFHHHLLANVTLYLALAYAIEQDRQYSDKAAEILRKYAEAYPGPHTSTTAGGILFQSLNEAMWIIPLAQAYDLIHDSPSLTDADRKLIEDRLFRPAADGISHCGTGGNWGSWHLSAVGVVGLAIRDASMVEFAVKAFQQQIRYQLGDDGLWPESVHCYHFFPLQAFIYFAEAAARAKIDLYNYEPKPGKSLHAMFTAPLAYMYPNFQLPAINDGWYASYLPLNSYEAARRRFDDPEIAWVVDKGYDIEADAQKTVLSRSISYLGGPSLYRFLLAPEKPERSAAPKFTSTLYSNFGLCTLRSTQTMLTFHYGRFLGHGQPDKLSFTLFSHDTLLAPDYGTPGYGSKILEWYTTTASHNTVLIDGKSQAPSKDNSIDAFFSGKIAQYAEATARDCYPGVAHTRKILLIGDACFIVDNLRPMPEHPELVEGSAHAPAAHDFDWLIHCEGHPRVLGKHASVETDLSAYPNVAFSRTEQIGDGYRISWTTDTCILSLAMYSDGATASLGKCPAESDARHASMLVCRSHGSEARFVTALLTAEPGQPSDISRADGVIHAAAADADYYLITAPTGQGDLTTDAELAAVRVEHGKPTGAVLIHGSWLKWQGNTLIERPSKSDCVEQAL